MQHVDKLEAIFHEGITNGNYIETEDPKRPVNYFKFSDSKVQSSKIPGLILKPPNEQDDSLKTCTVFAYHLSQSSPSRQEATLLKRKFTTHKIQTQLLPGTEWRVFHIFNIEDIIDSFPPFSAILLNRKFIHTMK